MKINRSEFLKNLALGVTAISTTNNLFAEASIEKKDEIKTVTVVGAGLSGLYAAYLLVNSGYEVTIVEAKNRMGGRIFTIKDEDSQLASELGGEWIQENHSTIRSLCKELDVELKAYPILKDILIGNKLIESNSVKTNIETKEILKRVLSLYEKMSDEKKQGLDKLDIYSFLKYQGVSQDDLYLLDMKYSVLFGEGIRNISAEKAIEIFESHESGFPFQYKVQSGTEKIIESLKVKLKEVSFIFSDPIISVEDTEFNVKIRTKSGKEITSDACIFSIPAGQLEKIKFTPEFPKDKKLAILQMRMSRMTKTSISYKGMENVKDKLFIQSDGIFQSITSNLHKSKSLKQGTLTLISTGDRSDTYSKLPEESLYSFFKNNLEHLDFLSNSKLDKIHLKIWQNEPFIEGGTSIYTPGSYEIKSILQRNHGRIHFAGEHLGKHSGTMEGALLSAIDSVNGL